MKRNALALIAVLFAAIPAAFAQETESQFFFPLACTLGTDCWTVNYVDIDPAQGSAKDFMCGTKTTDDHKGTDFALKDFAAIEKGVDVFAVADGKILRTRDGESDGTKTEEQLDEIRAAKRDCGNAVLIDHGNNLQTLYCHLRGGSLVVNPGDAIKQGAKIAQVGQSGVSSFPHLHFGIVRGNDIIDPYTKRTSDGICGTSTESMWSLGLPMKYEALSLFDAQFTNGTPDFTAIQKNAIAPTITTTATALSFWAGIYGAQTDDVITLTITTPDGKEFARKEYMQGAPQERQYYFTGRNELPALDTGTYTAKATLTRGSESQTIERTLTVAP